jgi:hypothetical protein
VYTFANGRLKVANRQFSSCNSEYEISFGNDADIRLCGEDANIQVLTLLLVLEMREVWMFRMSYSSPHNRFRL